MSGKEFSVGSFVGHYSCPDCGSSDNLCVYQKPVEDSDEVYFDATCQTPNCGFKSSEWLEEHNIISGGKAIVKPKAPFRMTADLQERLNSIKSIGSRNGWKSRKITKETDDRYGVCTEFKQNSEGKMKVYLRYYPSTKNGLLLGYHVRNDFVKQAKKEAKLKGLPKPKGFPFFPVGYCKVDSELFGQSLFTKGGKYLVICAGEEDALAAYQALKSDKYETACVSPTIGEGNAYKQIQANYEFISSFEKVIIVFDQDEAGFEGAEQIAKLLKPSQAHIAKLDANIGDCSKYLVAGKEKELKTAILWDSEQYSPAGIVGSSLTYSSLLERASFVKIPLPAFAEQWQDMLNGGIALGEITTIAAASSVGKTTLVNELLYHLVFNSPYKVGIISLESDVGELTENLLSLHVNKKLSNMGDDQKMDYFKSEKGLQDYKELTTLPDGSDRYYILDHQGAVTDGELMNKIEYLVKGLGCKAIVLDPITLALSGKQNDGMDEFMSDLLRFVKREKVAHINVAHVRKNSSGNKANSTGADIHEEDIKGSGSLFQVSMNVILLMRDKENEDPIIRNTTKAVQSKARRTGNTGVAGYWLYNNETSRMEEGKDPHGDYSADQSFFEELGAFEADEEELLNM